MVEKLSTTLMHKSHALTCYVLAIARWEQILPNCSYRPLELLTQDIDINLVLWYDN